MNDAIPLSPEERLKLAEQYATRAFGRPATGQIRSREAFLARFAGALTELSEPSPGQHPIEKNLVTFRLVARRLNTDPAGFKVDRHFAPPDQRRAEPGRPGPGLAGLLANEYNFNSGLELGKELDQVPGTLSPVQIARAVIKDMNTNGYYVVGSQVTNDSAIPKAALKDTQVRQSLHHLAAPNRQALPSNKP